MTKILLELPIWQNWTRVAALTLELLIFSEDNTHKRIISYKLPINFQMVSGFTDLDSITLLSTNVSEFGQKSSS